MRKAALWKGLFWRLQQSGLHPVICGELASANYPHRRNRPTRQPTAVQERVWAITEAYLDLGTLTLEQAWRGIWSQSPYEYFGIAPGSPAATAWGLTDAAGSKNDRVVDSAAETVLSGHQVENVRSGKIGGFSYEDWVVICVHLAEQRRISRHLIEDLIPGRDDEWWSLEKSMLARSEALLEEKYPGRQAWLAVEGVRPQDFDAYWTWPACMRRFIESLISRNIELEVESRTEAGETAEHALMVALLFIPRYSAAPPGPDEDNDYKPLPFELFARVDPYWQKLSDEEIQRRAMENHWRSANEHVRAMIAAGRL
jgi:hypothetical protein